MALHYIADRALRDLLTAWRHYDDTRRSNGYSFDALGRARIQLDEARGRMHRIREAVHPNDYERRQAQTIALCASLDEIVYLSWNHVDEGDPTHLRCVCGQLVPFER